MRKKTRKYYSYYLFGLCIENPIWTWEKWEKCLPLLQPIINLSPETPFIKTYQSFTVPYGKNMASFKDYSFGRMVWNETNNHKWTTKYMNNEDCLFFDTEIAYPSRNSCNKNNCEAELLIIIKNENLSNSKDVRINQSVTIHIADTIVDKNMLPEIETNILEICKLLDCKIAGKILRLTAYKSDLGLGYTDTYWDGSRLVLNRDESDFSENYKRYGIVKMDLGSC